MSMESKVAQKLISRRKTLAIAESCTGGLVTHRLTNIPGSSAFLKVGIVAYSNDIKIKLLKVPAALLAKHGAVSQEIATAMAKNVRKIYRTDFGIGITGIAGPDGGIPATLRGGLKRAAKPVGLVFIALASNKKILCREYHFKGARLQIKTQSTTEALKLLLKFIVD